MSAAGGYLDMAGGAATVAGAKGVTVSIQLGKGMIGAQNSYFKSFCR
jgi:hypothetical protein